MIGQKVYWRVVPVLVASAVLGFGQTTGMYPPNDQTQPPIANTTTRAAHPAGPGTINYVEGQVSLNGQALTANSVGSAALSRGQVINTQYGYAEVLLTPGAFLRLGNGSELRMLSAGLANTQVELVRGAAMLEVDQLIKDTTLTVSINETRTRIEKSGLYKFDAGQQAVSVLDGKASVEGPAGSKTLGKRDQVLLADAAPLKKHSFDENAVKAEPLYVWSMARSQSESEASGKAARNPSVYLAAGPGWFWDPYWGGYGFWPLTASLYSPFGGGFYSPAYFGFGYYGGYYGGFYPGWRYYGRGRVAGITAHPSIVRSSGFHSGGFSGGGFHGGGGRR
jgi:hypothetical protein